MEPQHHRLCLENLPVAVSRLRVDGEVPTITQKLTGGQCCVFKADFLSGESWAVRVPVLVNDRAGIRIIIQAEADLLQQLEMKGFLWAPKYQGHDASFNNDIGCPFIALAWIPGNPLSWSDDHPPRSLRDKVLSQMARIQESLIECTKQDGASAVQYFERIIENKIRRVRDGSLPDLTENDCIDQKDRLSAVLHPDLTYAPFAIDHGDLAPQNIIADSDYNICGIIDWGFSATAPLQMAAGLPRFLRLQDLVLPPSISLKEDRASYMAFLQTRSSQASSWMILVQGGTDVDFRHCFLESIVSKGMHRRMVELKWEIPVSEQE